MKKNSMILFLLLALICLNVFSAEINISDVHRNLTLSDDEPIYKDFYLNAGEGSGLKKNLVVNVKRKITIKDSSAKTLGDFETTIGQVRIIHVDAKMSVAREYKLASREDEPVVDQVGFMTGDRIDLASSFIDASKPTKKKIAEAPQSDSAQRSPAEINPSGTTSPLITPEKLAVPVKSANAVPIPEI